MTSLSARAYAIALGAAVPLLSTGCEPESNREAALAILGGSPQAPRVDPGGEARSAFNPRLLRRFKPARSVIQGTGNPITEAKVRLGQMLYHETRLSKSQEISCNTCHKLDGYGVDGEKTSRGHNGQRGDRNAPTVYHAAGHFEQFWDGRMPSVEEQALGPILNPAEMAAPSEKYVIAVLSSMPPYLEAFQRAFPGEPRPVTLVNVGKAIAAFERNLTTRARWDDYLEGEENALSAHEVEGLKLFTNLGCMVCHTGELLGGSMYEKVGAVEPWPNQTDQGRYEVTQRAGDRMMFKVPSLRNVERTGPYFHDGSATDLPAAVRMMGRHQLGLELQPREVESIVAWLKSLTGSLPMQYVSRPELPPSTKKTPPADRT